MIGILTLKFCRYFNVNVPLADGASDTTLLTCLRSVMSDAVETFDPDCIVMVRAGLLVGPSFSACSLRRASSTHAPPIP